MADLEIYDRISTGGTSWVAATGVPDTPRVMVIAASGDFRVGYSDTEPVNNWMHIENTAKMPFVLRVDDPTKLWFQTPLGSNLINMMGYPVNTGFIPYC
jgi:hypothetical protein